MQVAHVNRDFSLDRVVPFFQPIIDIHNDIVWRYECLARFINVEQQSFVPTELLYLVDRRHSKAHLTHTIFNGSANYFRHINMAWSINLSLQDMLDPEMTDFMRTQLQDYPNPSRISIEIATTNALKNPAAFNEFALLSKSLNLTITLDQLDPQQEDLLQLLSLPVEAIKVPIRDIRKSQHDSNVTDALTVFFSQAKEKGIDIIAEHIEHKPELDMTRALGIQYAQGFHISLPKASID
jgi:EAL domain-containing protein (putative c-di-GMP-specific phosphodiesterase class I)